METSNQDNRPVQLCSHCRRGIRPRKLGKLAFVAIAIRMLADYISES